jgi:hypothetical protein
MLVYSIKSMRIDKRLSKTLLTRVIQQIRHLVSYSLGEDVDVSIPEVVVSVVETRHHQPALLHLALHLQHVGIYS